MPLPIPYYLMKRIDKGYRSNISCLKQIMIPLIGYADNITLESSPIGNNIVFAAGVTSSRPAYIPVNLPNGAIVIKIEVWGTTIAAGTPDGLIELELRRSDNTISIDTMATFHLTEGNNNASDTSIAYATIDADYCYYIGATAMYTYAQERVYGIQITYLDRKE